MELPTSQPLHRFDAQVTQSAVNCTSSPLDWFALPVQEWDLESPLCTTDGAVVLFNPSEVVIYARANGIPLESLRLVFCAPQMVAPLVPLALFPVIAWQGLPMPAALKDACNAFNTLIAQCPPVAYKPLRKAALMPESLLFSETGK